ncbi:MAG: pyruvate kinase [Bdellovibrionales bacterium RIFCSPHIGHO2_01_FULL_40_29]|nr:MAG: pyruvate kinase [Bdellovibrionales bacterium RIFCSPHIGHO2_01_FULL_40_29]OFZ32980.1 MAG: pyruvate kinase [Bdellovibrionales bacterium RIFCSPHIGHO2_02_FULL_40_15]
MLFHRRAKIVATIGPSSKEPENLKKAILAGMNVARLNFSHGTHPEHLAVIKSLREISAELKAPVTILQDLQGPKVRVGLFEKGSIVLVQNQIVTVTIEDVIGRDGLIPSDFKELCLACKKGNHILIDDGLIELEVLNVGPKSLEAKVIYGGILKNRKGMNLPGVTLPVEALTSKDREDLEFGLQNGVDYIALSFVRHAKDIRQLREIIEKHNSPAKIVAKIEMLEALDNLEEIIRLSDVVMVARGDLAVEIGQSRLPREQKRIIKLSNQLGKPVITATQMLDSMVENPRPTRAEITDVANAILDGTDAVMLSAESASGKYPFKAIRTMHEIILEVEKQEENYYKISLDNELLSTPAAIAASSVLSALKLNASVIVCLTTTGKTAQIIASYRPKAQIVAMTKDLDVLNRLEIIWGLQTLHLQPYETLKDILFQVEKLLIENGLAKTGERIILTLGQPIADHGKTNAIHVHVLGGEEYMKSKNEKLPLRFAQMAVIG